VSSDTLSKVAVGIEKSGTFKANMDEEHQAFQLMQEVCSVTAAVPGSASSCSVMRSKLRTLVVEKGLPTFYLKVYPADVYNPIVNILAGKNVSLNDMFSNQSSTYWSQATLIAQNPLLGAQFFNIVMKNYISCIL
ncbi:hypothetical protein AGABI2DRAFT_55968, partial [Agaricus bisporus var. bisporus H97]|uniref:hypothetical protein n=1 Tax=Agaricus bisporus var. bisporus (strain H97 / ATCC MYA-4626 / FGSC 10389) TaxID=936046 RepID=UPI00029F74C6